MSLITKEVKQEEEVKQIWTREGEILLAKWADKASCYRWLHDMSEKKFTYLNSFIQIPIIVLSTLTGAVSVGSDSIFPPYLKEQSGIILGSFSILTGIIGTVGNFLRYAQQMEGHKIAAIQWSKFQRNIAAELAIHPDNRQPATEFFTICRSEMDRLIEQSPSIPVDIISSFESKFKKVKISKPDVCNVLEPVDIYKPHEGNDWVKTINEKKKSTELSPTNNSSKEISSREEMIITFDNSNTPRKGSDNSDNSNESNESKYIDGKQNEIKRKDSKNKLKLDLESKLHNSILNSLNK